MKIKSLLAVIMLVLCLSSVAFQALADDEEYHAVVQRYEYRFPDLTVIGNPTWYKIGSKETLLDISRKHGLGYNDIDLLFPRMDAWIPPTDKKIVIPTFWVLPPTQHQQLVINVPELRLYLFEKTSATVQTYPIGIGDEGWETPLGTFNINDKRANPIWYIPASLQEKYGMASMPPGPENPLGEYVMKFSAGAYGVHGTAMPWGVGRLVSHGCIRCYPEHIKILYPQVPMGSKLEIIYEPIKFGQKNGQVFVEAHPDVYRRIPDYAQYAMNKLAQHPLAKSVDQKKYLMTVRLQNGVPTNVSRFAADDVSFKLVDIMQE
jgi:L,D-transpeptidase ErfK/SrfK